MKDFPSICYRVAEKQGHVMHNGPTMKLRARWRTFDADEIYTDHTATALAWFDTYQVGWRAEIIGATNPFAMIGYDPADAVTQLEMALEGKISHNFYGQWQGRAATEVDAHYGYLPEAQGGMVPNPYSFTLSPELKSKMYDINGRFVCEYDDSIGRVFVGISDEMRMAEQGCLEELSRHLVDPKLHNYLVRVPGTGLTVSHTVAEALGLLDRYDQDDRETDAMRAEELRKSQPTWEWYLSDDDPLKIAVVAKARAEAHARANPPAAPGASAAPKPTSLH